MNPIIKAIRDAIGAKPGESVRIITPQFDRRPNDPEPGVREPDATLFAQLADLPEPVLRELGLRPWGTIGTRSDGKDLSGQPVLWLFPHEWYEFIPDGTPVVDIFGNAETFVSGETDNDKRFGCLSYGVLIDAKESSDGR